MNDSWRNMMALFALFVAVMTATWTIVGVTARVETNSALIEWNTDRIDSLLEVNDRISKSIQRIEKIEAGVIADRWKGSDQIAWEAELARLNPGLILPSKKKGSNP